MDYGISTGAPHCRNCGGLIKRNPHLGDRAQLYCGKAACQRARKAEWNRRKYASNPAFCEAEKKRVRISLRALRRGRRSGHPPESPALSATEDRFRRLHAQVNQVGLLLRGMASHSTGIVNGVELQACLERYADRGRLLERGEEPA